MVYSHKTLKHLIMPLADKAMGTSLTRYWKEIPKMNTWSSDEIVKWQDDKFCRLVKEAYENAAYYRRVMDEIGIVHHNVKGIHGNNQPSNSDIIHKSEVQHMRIIQVSADVNYRLFLLSNYIRAFNEPWQKILMCC